MWHKSKEPPCLFTHTVDTCYYIPTTCLYLTSRRIVCGQSVPFRTSSSQVVRTGSQWQRKHLPTVPEYKYLPNKPVVGTVWHPLTWLSVQYTFTGAPVKQTAQLSTQTQCADAVWPHSVANIMSQAPCYFTFHQEYTVLLYIPSRLHVVTLHSTKNAPCYFTFNQECTLLFYIPPRLHLVTLHFTKTAPCYFKFHQDCTLLLYIPQRLYRVILHSTKIAPCYFTLHQDWTFSQVLLPKRTSKYQSQWRQNRPA